MRFASLLVAGLLLGGCTCSNCDTETQMLVETLPAAGAAATAGHLARCIETDLNSHTAIPESEKAYLRARAQVVGSHSLKLKEAIDRFDPAKGDDQAITVGNLRARGEALDEEVVATFREWTYWQVQHGVRKPEEVFQYFDFTAEFE